jgi:hypothetical protein
MELYNNPMHSTDDNSYDSSSIYGNNLRKKSVAERSLEEESYDNYRTSFVRIEDDDSLFEEKRINYKKEVEKSDKIPIFYELFLDQGIDLKTYFKQFIIHVFYPLFNRLSDNRPLQLLDYKLNSVHFSYIYFPFLFSNVAIGIYLYTMFNYEKGDIKYESIVGTIFIPLFVFFLHRSLVALKWASLSKTEYSRIVDAVDSKILMEYRNNFNLNSVWNNSRSDDIIEHEIVDAAISVGAKLHVLFIRIENPENCESSFNNFLKYKALMLGKCLDDINVELECPEMELQEDGDYIISLFCYLRQLTKYIDRQNKYQEISSSEIWLKIMLSFLFLADMFANVIIIKEENESAFSIENVIYYIALCHIVYVYGSSVTVFTLQALKSTLKIKDSLLILHEVIKLPNSKVSAKYNDFKQTADVLFENYNSNNCSDFYNDFTSNITDKKLCKPHNIDTFKTCIKEIDCLKSYNEYLDLPIIDFSNESNIIAWTYARYIYLNFGTRFIRRSENFLGNIYINFIYLFIF